MAYVKKIWEDYPNTTTQIKAEDLNNIEDGIENIDNVTRFLTATAVTNGDYKVNITNTLATGMILNIAFPAATNGASNARLSINGVSGTYRNIKFFDTIQTLASEVQSSVKSLRFDGTDLIILDESYTRTNANGTYMRFADGRMTCTKEVSVYTAVNYLDGGFYRSGTQTLGDFAIAFYATPTVFFDLKSVGGDTGVFVFSAFYGTYPPSTTSWGRRVIMSVTSLLSNSYVISCLATGRWKA